MPSVLITGASRGIGRAAAFAFARDAWFVGVNYCQSEKEALEVVQSIADIGGLACALQGDVRSPADCAAMARAMEARFGPLDALVNNAGISLPGLFTEAGGEAAWQHTLDVDLTGARNMAAAVLSGMISRKRGAIVNVSSMWGLCGASFEVPYSAAKAGLIGFTKALARELGPSNIRVNCVAPGVIQTDMNAGLSKEDLEALAEATPLCRLGRPEEVAEAILFLAGPRASFITAQVLGVDGGYI